MYRDRLASACNSLGNLQKAAGRTGGGGAELLSRAIELRKQLAAKQPEVDDYRDSLALRARLRRPRQPAESRRRRAGGGGAELPPGRSSCPSGWPAASGPRSTCTATGWPRPATASATCRKPPAAAEAERSYLRAIELEKQLAAERPEVDDYRDRLASACACTYGDLQKAAGRAAEAERSYLRAIELRKQLAAERPNRPDYRINLGQSMVILANLFDETGRPRRLAALGM